VIDAELVRSLIDLQFPSWAGLSLEPVHPRGTDNVLFRLGDDMVVRLPRDERTAETLLKERRWLPVLAPSLPVEVPAPLAEGHPTADYPFEWSIYSWLEGDPAPAAANDLAGFLDALQRIDPSGGPPPGEHNFFRGAPLALRDRQTRDAINAVDPPRRGPITDAWEAALAVEPWSRPPVWIHGDLDTRNMLARDGAITGVVDWGGLGVGDPACDVMVAWKMLPVEAHEGFRSRLHVDDATWVRARGWVVSQAVIALAYYTEKSNPTLVAEARRWLGRATDPSSS
jgi:aminoglycoside phosphotransferase (APT) family kinase protein